MGLLRHVWLMELPLAQRFMHCVMTSHNDNSPLVAMAPPPQKPLKKPRHETSFLQSAPCRQDIQPRKKNPLLQKNTIYLFANHYFLLYYNNGQIAVTGIFRLLHIGCRDGFTLFPQCGIMV